MSRYTTTLDRLPAAVRRDGSKRGRKLAGMLLGFLLATSVTCGAAVALITAVASNTPGQAVSSGKLSLSLADNGAGFTQAVANLVPTDTVYRYVDVSNSGTADGTNLTLQIASSATNKLTTDTTNGLQLAIAACTGGIWTATTGACSGTITPLVASTPVSGVTGTPITVVSGAFPQGALAHLRVAMTLPAQTEVTTNGTLPANSIQSLSTTLTYTFTVTQRAGATTSS
jgi:hypothetical protein